jgi:hypothetical protein
MLGEVEGTVTLAWRVRKLVERASFNESKVALNDAASLEPVSAPLIVRTRENGVYLRSMLRMTIRVLSASDAFVPIV